MNFNHNFFLHNLTIIYILWYIKYNIYTLKIAILHEMFVKLGWAEKVVETWCKMYPNADIFTLIYDEKKCWNIFPKNKINKQVFKLTTQKIYNITKKQRLCLPFMANSIEQLDFSNYDVVLCSSSWFAHGAITKPETKFIVYYHSPARYMWDWTNEYKKDIWANKWIKWYILNKLFLKLRQWDFIASNRADITLANSKNTQNRITKYYRKKSEILYPPVETKRFWKTITNMAPVQSTKKLNIGTDIEKNYYIIISALTEFKKIDIAIKSFNKMNDQNLVIIWEWKYRAVLEKKCSYSSPYKGRVRGGNIIFTWAKYSDELVSLIQNSNWLIFPWEEDFWIVPIEVMAAWKPIFAYNWWWLKETVLKWITWEFFDNKNWNDFIEKFKIFDKNNKNWFYSEKDCKKQAELFSEKNFKIKIKELVEN